MKTGDKKRIISHLIEFFIVGLILGVTEDIIAIKLATDTPITTETIKVAFWVALPFAIVSELLIDVKFFRKLFRKRILKK